MSSFFKKCNTISFLWFELCCFEEKHNKDCFCSSEQPESVQDMKYASFRSLSVMAPSVNVYATSMSSKLVLRSVVVVEIDGLQTEEHFYRTINTGKKISIVFCFCCFWADFFSLKLHFFSNNVKKEFLQKKNICYYISKLFCYKSLSFDFDASSYLLCN